MTGLSDAVLEAHGGRDRWQRFSTIEATIVSGGMLWEIKGQPPSAPRVGPYLTLMRGISFEEENLRWAKRALAIVKQRQGAGSVR
jgi:virulence activator alpha